MVDFGPYLAHHRRFMKKTLIFSLALMGLLNLGQFAHSYRLPSATFRTPKWIATKPPATPTPKPTLVAAGPATTSVATIQTQLAFQGLKPEHAALYLQVQQQTGTPWQLLAAIHHSETGQRSSTSITSAAGAQGPMQFMPATWNTYSADGDGNGSRSITDLEDAMLGAGRYLAANGAARGNYRNALWRYNHSDAYVNRVLSLARKLGL